MKTFVKPYLLLMILSLVLVTAACGTAANNGDNHGAASNSQAGHEDGHPASQDDVSPGDEEQLDEPITIEHAMGTETIDTYPKKVVVLEWSLAENMLALGVQPVGVADMEGYKNWVGAGEFDASVIDVGTRQEPDLEAIAALEPDLIFAVDFRVAHSYEQLDRIAPTIVFGSEFEENLRDPYHYMEETFYTMAQVLGKTEKAEEVMAHLEGAFENASQALKDAGRDGAPFVISQAWTNQNAAVMRLFTTNSMGSQLLEKIGLHNAFESDVFQPNGFETASVERLADVQDANFFYIAQDDDNPFENQLKDNAVWNGLNFVKENRYYALGGDMWLFGGPLSSERVVEKAVELLTQ
ncbi:ferrichrome ABC transporter substrate-binding protein [Xylanibacillus composti]|uniref:Ferrichrome ABC transporter substrate-binding protein n=1 Tax=Xylanibacillus composti TaxID=1572762 RepID=A0A8J4M3W7_9BACL|nr:iron-siderophore ABC transporter substrate-binding protein [Xylanibacillus composti]GIQ70522.1 ferrichrome ABC transporter substrate-binding protein [Xylanibacillus composti]